MARSRVIKPEFWTDEKLARLSRDSRLLFVGLWSVSDDYGVAKGHPAFIKSQLFPYDETLSIKQIGAYLSELVNEGFVCPFKHNGEQYLYIKGFTKHQKVDHPSKLRNPEPPDQETLDKLSLDIREGSRGFRDETETETETETKDKALHQNSPSKKARKKKNATKCEPLDGFDPWWADYPRKVDKKKAQSAWKSLNPSPELQKTMQAKLAEQKKSEQWQDTQYIPHPSTYLNGRRWEDEPLTPGKPKSKLNPIAHPDYSDCITQGWCPFCKTNKKVHVDRQDGKATCQDTKCKSHKTFTTFDYEPPRGAYPNVK